MCRFFGTPRNKKNIHCEIKMNDCELLALSLCRDLYLVEVWIHTKHDTQKRLFLFNSLVPLLDIPEILLAHSSIWLQRKVPLLSTSVILSQIKHLRLQRNEKTSYAFKGSLVVIDYQRWHYLGQSLSSESSLFQVHMISNFLNCWKLLGIATCYLVLFCCSFSQKNCGPI